MRELLAIAFLVGAGFVLGATWEQQKRFEFDRYRDLDKRLRDMEDEREKDTERLRKKLEEQREAEEPTQVTRHEELATVR